MKSEHTVEEIIAQMPVAQEVCDEEGKCEPDAVYISDVRKALIALHHSHTEEVEQARRDMFQEIKSSIESIEINDADLTRFDSGANAMKSIILSRLSSLEWFRTLITPNPHST